VRSVTQGYGWLGDRAAGPAGKSMNGAIPAADAVAPTMHLADGAL